MKDDEKRSGRRPRVVMRHKPASGEAPKTRGARRRLSPWKRAFVRACADELSRRKAFNAGAPKHERLTIKPKAIRRIVSRQFKASGYNE